jgi:hypothetical protein
VGGVGLAVVAAVESTLVGVDGIGFVVVIGVVVVVDTVALGTGLTLGFCRVLLIPTTAKTANIPNNTPIAKRFTKVLMPECTPCFH